MPGVFYACRNIKGYYSKQVVSSKNASYIGKDYKISISEFVLR